MNRRKKNVAKEKLPINQVLVMPCGNPKSPDSSSYIQHKSHTNLSVLHVKFTSGVRVCMHACTCAHACV